MNYEKAIIQYNGNIAAMVWNTTGKTKQGYGFTYDGLNRLKSSSYGEGSSTSAPEFAIPLPEIGFYPDDMGRPNPPG